MVVLWFEFLVVHEEFVTDTVIAADLEHLAGLTTQATCSYTAPAVLLSSHKQDCLPSVWQSSMVRLLCCRMSN